MGMRLGNSNSGGTAKMRKGREQGLNRKRFSTFYSNTAGLSGNCRVTCSPLSLSTADGTYTFIKGSPLIKWVNDAGNQNYIFSLRDMTSESVSRGTHLLVFSRGR
tara:strand:+ start:195 stop:509 length:315 start_codon:yes stop_codon:yes gene_type:complete